MTATNAIKLRNGFELATTGVSTVKLSPTNLHPDRSEAATRECLKRLGLDRADLLIADFSEVEDVNNNDLDKSVTVEDVWRGLESIYDMNLTRSLGVSNASVDQIERIMEIAVWPIHVVQNEAHSEDLTEVCKKHRIAITSYESESSVSDGVVY